MNWIKQKLLEYYGAYFNPYNLALIFIFFVRISVNIGYRTALYLYRIVLGYSVHTAIISTKRFKFLSLSLLGMMNRVSTFLF